MYRGKTEQGPNSGGIYNGDESPSSNTIDIDTDDDKKTMAIKKDDSRAANGAAMRSRSTAAGTSLSSSKDREARRQLRREKQRNGPAARATQNAMNGGGSILWPVMLIGIILCITDVIYMMRVLERQENKEHKKVQHEKHHQKLRRQQELKKKQLEVQEDEDDPSNYIHSEEDPDKHRTLRLIREAGVTYMDKNTYDSLPRWSEVVRLYGEGPKIVGLDTCQAFQTTGNAFDHFVGTAGNFNTGTNLLAELLIGNCHMQARMDKFGADNRGIRWQVPWGKHTPPGDEDVRLQHKTKKDKDVDPNSILPAVTVRDPYQWLQSMCRHPYTARWIHADHCPNLVPTSDNRRDHPELAGKMSIPVGVKYAAFQRDFESLVHYWNEWNAEYIDGVDIPRILVRYEDLLFYPHQVVTKVCECAGGSMRKDGTFKYVAQSAKKGANAHGPMSARTGYVDAMIKYGKATHRFDGFTPHDLKYFHDTINKEYMQMFGYHLYPKEKLLKSLRSLKQHNHNGNKKVAVIEQKEHAHTVKNQDSADDDGNTNVIENNNEEIAEDQGDGGEGIGEEEEEDGDEEGEDEEQE